MGSTIFIRKAKEKQRWGKVHVQLLLQEIITQVSEFKHIYSQGPPGIPLCSYQIDSGPHDHMSFAAVG